MKDDLPTTAGNPEPEPAPAREEDQVPAAPVGEDAASQPTPTATAVQEETPAAEEATPPGEGATPEEAAAPADEPAEGAAPGELATDALPNNKHWYVVKVQSGREESIREAIEKKVKIEGLEEFFGQIYIPTEKVTEMRSGKRVTRERKTLPGYIMAEVEYNDRVLYLFRETSGVGDFVGGGLNRAPTPMTQREVERWLGRPKDAGEPEKVQHDFERGDRVRVKEGMFKDMEGEVKDIIEAKNQLKVELTIFGRGVAVEMEYWQVEHV